MFTVLFILGCLWLTLMTWVFYLAIMNLKRNRKKLSTQAYIFAYPALATGLLLDVLFNLVVGSILFLELPQYTKGEWLFTGRVSRWNNYTNWRGKLAFWFCMYFLDPFEDGGHCS